MVLWMAGLAASAAALAVARAASARPPAGVEFDRPLARALVAAFAFAALVVNAIFAVTVSGVVAPALFGALLWAAARLAGARLDLARAGAAAGPLAALGFFCALLSFQNVFGDRGFALLNIFADM